MSFSKPPDYSPLFAALASQQNRLASDAPTPPPMFGQNAGPPPMKKSATPTFLGAAALPTTMQLGKASLIGSAA